MLLLSPRRSAGVCGDVTGLRLHAALDEASLLRILRPGLRGLVLEAYGAGNGPTDRWFLDALAQAVEDEVVVVVITQCAAGTVRAGHYATGELPSSPQARYPGRTSRRRRRRSS